MSSKDETVWKNWFVFLLQQNSFQPGMCLNLFFEIPDMYTRTITNYEFLMQNSDIISNFVQGSTWRNMNRDTENGKKVLPILLYYDDYENCNPLGSPTGIHKCGAIYFSIPCLPDEIRSKLNSIFLFVLYNSLDYKIMKWEQILRKIVEELEFLEAEGITLNTNSGEQKLFFKLAQILGDNLGIHSIAGFVESFNTKYFCRFCMISQEEFRNIFMEDSSVLRDEKNYDDHLKINDYKKTGVVVENCLFNELTDFHVTKNVGVDVMHDILEGTCQYDLAKILNSFIHKKVFSFKKIKWSYSRIQIQ